MNTFATFKTQCGKLRFCAFARYLFMLFVTALSCAHTYAQDGGPKFRFDEEVHDFGIIKRGAKAIDTFWFTNIGDRPLNVQGVSPSCGCTNVEWTKYPVHPGKRGYVSLSLKTEEQHGVFNKEVYIQSDAVNNPRGEKRYTLYIKGDARDKIKAVKRSGRRK